MRDRVMENCRPGQQLAAGRIHLQVNDPLKKKSKFQALNCDFTLCNYFLSGLVTYCLNCDNHCDDHNFIFI